MVLFHYNGVAPRKISKTIQVLWGDAMAAVRESGEEDAKARSALAAVSGNAITVAFPEYVQDPFAIKGSEIRIGNERVSTVLVENISAIAQKDLQDRMAAIRGRAIARATIKFAIAKAAQIAATAVARQAGGGMWGALAGLVVGGVARAAAAATEIADTRAWGALPAEIRMARFSLPPGKHDLKVAFKDAGGDTVFEDSFPQVPVAAGRRTYLQYRTAQ